MTTNNEVTPLPEFEQPVDIEDARDRINTKVKESLRTWDEFYYQLGNLLLWAKNHVEYGDFRAWVQYNIDLVSYRTCQYAMRHAKKCHEAGHLVPYTTAGQTAKNASIAILNAANPPENKPKRRSSAGRRSSSLDNF